MNITNKTNSFEKLVVNKFNLFNSLFLSLPFNKIGKTGMMLPQLQEQCINGLENGLQPTEILERFFKSQSSLHDTNDQIDFLFRVIQYVERQVVLFDSIEDAAFKITQKDGNKLSLNDFIHLLESKRRQAEIPQKLADFSARIVFTAHPTQFYPPAILEIIQQLRDHVNENDLMKVDMALQQLGLTSFGNQQKPTPFDEAKNIIYYLRNVYYDALGDFYADLKKQFQNHNFNNPEIVKLGFWPGGDRDGNPYVTAKVSMQVADELRMTLMKCYYKDLKDLSKKLSFRGVEEIINQLRTALYPSLFQADQCLTFEEIITPLEKAKQLVIEKYNNLYSDKIDLLIDKVTIFRTHFATLDIRQNHEVHRQTVEAVLKNNRLINESISELTDKRLMQILTEEQLNIDPAGYDTEIINDTIASIKQIEAIQRKNGEEGCNRYIISNSEDEYSILFVFGLMRWIYTDKQAISVDIVPLFESMDGMENAPQIMQRLFDNAVYKKHLKSRKSKQTLMLGFSDGTKDGGYLKANWSIYKTKEALTAVCEKNGISPLFFDGRGGPPARGGGKTHQFYASQSDKIANNEIQLTIQGQTISSRFATPEHFKYNIEQLLTAALSHQINGRENAIHPSLRKTIESLSAISFEKYVALKNHPLFMSYLENKSTLRFYSKANIGSRPAKRGQEEKLKLSDLRAISFVGSWSQLKQNVPGYFGIGTALNQLKEEGRLDELRLLFQNAPFFRILILNAMMSLSKSNFKLTAHMAKDKEYQEFWHILNNEYELSKKMLLLISGYESLMEEEPVTKKSIMIREQIVLPLLVIQQFALQMIEKNDSNKAVYEKMVTRSLYGNINASRNSA
ncbi:MAG: phosphoenolpyruvate carboxylase [Bacteroidales bacterium]|jgi:phosphoenolpyruvate carboxylase|nr:phosphoenolpyruvate carboxylase [Bacteroidales bacterium]